MDQNTYQELQRIYPKLVRANLLELSICVLEEINKYEEENNIPKECSFLNNGEIQWERNRALFGGKWGL